MFALERLIRSIISGVDGGLYKFALKRFLGYGRLIYRDGVGLICRWRRWVFDRDMLIHGSFSLPNL